MPHFQYQGRSIYYQLLCPSNDKNDYPTIVMIPGTGMPLDVWRVDLAPRLLSYGYRLLVFDSPGSGRSDGLVNPTSIDEIANEVLALVDDLGIDEFMALGLSQGSFVAEVLASRSELSTRLSSAILLGGAGPTSAFGVLWARSWLDILASANSVPESLSVVSNLSIGLPHFTLSSDDAKTDGWASLLALPRAADAESYRHLQVASLEWIQSSNSIDRYENICCPISIIAFEWDLMWPPKSGYLASMATRNGATYTVKGVGHLDGLFDGSDQISDFIADHCRRLYRA